MVLRRLHAAQHWPLDGEALASKKQKAGDNREFIIANNSEECS